MKTLVVYFSASGVTKRRAEELAKVAGADLYEIVPKQPYTQKDLGWRDRTSRSTRENADASARPELAGAAIDVSSHERIYLGFPIWWGIAPKPINAFVDAHDLVGKDIYVFATSGGSGVDRAMHSLEETYPALSFKGGKLVHGTIRKKICKSGCKI